MSVFKGVVLCHRILISFLLSFTSLRLLISHEICLQNGNLELKYRYLLMILFSRNHFNKLIYHLLRILFHQVCKVYLIWTRIFLLFPLDYCFYICSWQISFGESLRSSIWVEVIHWDWSSFWKVCFDCWLYPSKNWRREEMRFCIFGWFAEDQWEVLCTVVVLDWVDSDCVCVLLKWSCG